MTGLEIEDLQNVWSGRRRVAFGRRRGGGTVLSVPPSSSKLDNCGGKLFFSWRKKRERERKKNVWSPPISSILSSCTRSSFRELKKWKEGRKEGGERGLYQAGLISLKKLGLLWEKSCPVLPEEWWWWL